MDDVQSPGFGPINDEALAAAASAGPAVYADRLVVTEREGVVRLSFVETGLNNELIFRGAAIISVEGADQLAGMLRSMVDAYRSRK